MESKHKYDNIKVCLLGPAFDTGNLGVSALTESSLKAVFYRWPDAEVTLIGSSRRETEYQLRLLGRDVTVKCLPIRFCKNIFLRNHFCVLLFYALLFKIFRSPKVQERIAARNQYVKAISATDIIADITGGDSFSDIYGVRRFVTGFLRKWLCKVFRRKLVLLPQTYGPFNSRLTKVMTRHILNYASVIYSRDQSGLSYVRRMLGNQKVDEKIRFMPDVAFILDSQKPDGQGIISLEQTRATSEIVVGLNISGMLLQDFQTKHNRFSLQVNYLTLIKKIIELLMFYKGTRLLLIPHVIGLAESQTPAKQCIFRKGYELSDDTACKKIYDQTAGKYENRILLVPSRYNHNEIKYIIGLCDFFIGSRMHACIAALSQGIPAIGLAYSKKFQGVFESVGAERLVVDMRRQGQNEILAAIQDAFEKREAMAKHLRRTIPNVQARVLNMFGDLER